MLNAAALVSRMVNYGVVFWHWRHKIICMSAVKIGRKLRRRGEGGKRQEGCTRRCALKKLTNLLLSLRLPVASRKRPRPATKMKTRKLYSSELSIAGQAARDPARQHPPAMKRRSN